MPAAVCFDLDGTLFDDRQYVRAGLERAGEVYAERTGVDLTDAFLRAYFQANATDATFDAVLAERGYSLDAVPELVDAYHANDAALVPFSDVEPTLSVLKNEYALGLVTGGRNGRAKLHRLGLADYFDIVIVTSELDTSKREPKPYKTALRELDVPAEAAVYVGDRPSLDVLQPRALGMRTVRVRRGQYAERVPTGDAVPDVTIDSLAELPDLLASLPDD
ncbi:HAD family hydrolase [Natronoarchaeum sp. GCM10025703]|uniref:HAD family hydrolase n=1 Tax=unclassified Natronoarchaeum TaxID=2620183 RepID=UPI0036067763